MGSKNVHNGRYSFSYSLILSENVVGTLLLNVAERLTNPTYNHIIQIAKPDSPEITFLIYKHLANNKVTLVVLWVALYW